MGLHSEGLNIISEGYLRPRFFFGGGEGGGGRLTFGRACFREGGGAYYILPGAIIGDGDRKRGVHAKPSKKTNVLFLAKIAPPSTSETRAGTRTFAWGSVTRFKLDSGSSQRLDTCYQQKL